MADLRVMEIPANRTGLRPGVWLRWEELRFWLVERHEQALADAIEEVIVAGQNVSVREITLLRSDA